MSTYEDRRAEAREEAWSAAHCLGCALGKVHQRCDWEANDTEDEGDTE